MPGVRKFGRLRRRRREPGLPGGESEFVGLQDAAVVAEQGAENDVGLVFSRTDDAARKEIQEALRTTNLPWPITKFWEGYFTGTKPTFKENE